MRALKDSQLAGETLNLAPATKLGQGGVDEGNMEDV